MSKYQIGDRIVHNLMPWFVMTVQAVKPCETDDHQAVQITDPEGMQDWLCTREVRQVPR
jgi:hypothetical protein